MTRKEQPRDQLMSGESACEEVDWSTLLRTHYAFQTGAFLSAAEHRGGGILCFSEISVSPIWNHAAWIDGTEGELSDFVEAAIGWHNEDRCPVMYLMEAAREQTLALKGKGFERFDEESWLAAVPRGEFSSRVREVGEIGEYVRVFSEAFSTREDGYGQALRSAGNSGHRHFALYLEGKAVAIGTLVQRDGLGCLYNVGTLPSARNKGFASELVQHLLAIADQAGCRKLFLQVEPGGAADRLYRKLGFVRVFSRTGFRLKNWAGGKRNRTQLSQIFPSVGKTQRASVATETRPLPRGLSTLRERERIGIAAWAYLLHRYTSASTVTLWVAHETATSIERIDVKVSSADQVAEWIKGLIIQGEPVARADAETLLSFHSHGAISNLTGTSVPLQLQLTSETVQISYRDDLFSKEVIRRLASHYVTVLQSILSSPGSQVKDLELLSDGERRQLIVDWNESALELTNATLTRLFEEQVERTPEAVAVSLVSTSGAGERLTYRQLNRRANRVAHRLLELGVSAEIPVCMLLERSLDCIVSLLAILKAGGIFVPLDPSSPAERIRQIVGQVEARVVITDRQFASRIHLPHGLVSLYLDESLEVQPHKNPSNRNKPEDAAYIIYTSGSTGQPKGVVVSHRAIVNHSVECRKHYGINSRDRVLQFSPLHFDASLEQIFPALIAGSVLMIRDAEVWSPKQFSQLLQNEQLTVIDLPTTYWHELVDYWEATRTAFANHSLRLAIVGGDAMSADRVEKWRRISLSKTRLVNAYGPTEATITAASFDLAESEGICGSTIPIGRLRGSRRAYVLDGMGRPVPVGIAGELHIGGPLLARGYYRDDKQTAERFIPDPFSDDPEARLYKTGDLVRYREDGVLEFLGRVDDQIKIRGFRVELGEIQAALRQHESVRDVLVIARSTGDGEKRPIAYVITNTVRSSEMELKKFLRGKLPEYMLPARMVLLAEWPMLTNGKVDRSALPVPEDQHCGTSTGPRDALELQLQLSFERVLKRAPIGIDQSFFELGGDSLQALELLVQVEKETGKQLPLGTLYQSSTVEAVAREVRRQVAAEQWSSLVPLQVRGRHSPLYLLHTTPGDILGYGNLVYRLGPERPCYGFQSLGLKDANLSHTSIEEMARYYVDLLRRFQPHGPYYLGGWCYGGILAVEMARLLKAQGEAIGLLALLETVAMPATVSNYRYYLHRSRCFLRMSPIRWWLYAREKIKYRRKARLANRMRFRDAGGAAGDARDARLAQLEYVYKTNLEALNRYRSTYYDGTVTLFNGAERDEALIPDQQYGWVGLARNVEIYEVPGNHDTMLAEPNVSALARVLNDALQRSEGRKTSP